MDHEWLIGLAIQTLLFLGGGWAMVLKNGWDNKALEKRMTEMQEELKKLAKVIIEQAVQTTRIDNLSSQVAQIDRRVEDLRRGNGFVRGRSGTDGEHP